MFKTIRFALLAVLFGAAGCSMDSVEDRGSTIECYETEDGLVCHDGEGDGTDGEEGEDEDGDGEKDAPVCTAEVTCEKVCEEGEGGFHCVKECTNGVRCEWGCEGDGEDACYEECTAPEECREEEPPPCEPGDDTPDGEGLLPDDCDGGGDDGGGEDGGDGGDGGGEEPPTDGGGGEEPPTDG